ncbi:MAG: hypothetical protein IH612_21535 [Desulfofustis sp.]|nr:hypothetical protein [Desulfofustis sp.]
MPLVLRSPRVAQSVKVGGGAVVVQQTDVLSGCGIVGIMSHYQDQLDVYCLV